MINVDPLITVKLIDETINTDSQRITTQRTGKMVAKSYMSPRSSAVKEVQMIHWVQTFKRKGGALIMGNINGCTQTGKLGQTTYDDKSSNAQ